MANPAEGYTVLARRYRPQTFTEIVGQEAVVGQELAERQRLLDANAVLQRRDYAFCLFPEFLADDFWVAPLLAVRAGVFLLPLAVILVSFFSSSADAFPSSSCP